MLLLLIAGATAAISLGGIAKANTSDLEWGDGSQEFQLCFVNNCTVDININNRVNDVTISQSTGVFDPFVNDGANKLTSPLPILRLVYNSSTGKYVSQVDTTFLFDGIVVDGSPTLKVDFFAGSTFTGVSIGPLPSNQNLAWDFNPAKLGVAVAGPAPLQTLITASFTLNASSITTGSYSGTIITRDRTSQVPGPLPILGVAAAFGASRKLRARIKAAA